MKKAIIAIAIAGFILVSCIASRIESQDSQDEAVENTILAAEPEPSRAEQVATALVTAYPQRIEKAEFRDGDWAILLDDTWFYYAEGRLLPEELREKLSEYSPVFFYGYQRELPPWTPLSPEQVSRFRNRNSDQPIRRPRSNYFFDALYQAHNRAESYERVETIQFLGHRVAVHNLISEKLSFIEEHILIASETDPQVRTWINNISNLEGWNWRNIAGSQSRSYHSYGAAIDILPRSLGGKVMYWQWAGPEWWNIPYESRYNPPDTVIEIFESYGFYWGGRWLHYFDTMHFEYRPEVFILSGITLAASP